MPATVEDHLFDRVAAILEQARANVVRAVNHNMVIAYWAIGREIVIDLQRGESRADYGQQVFNELSERLTVKYGAGWSKTNLWSFRLFYLLYADRVPSIPHTLCVESSEQTDLIDLSRNSKHWPIKDSDHSRAAGPDLTFHLSWSHYRTLIRVENDEARIYYEHAAIAEGWSVRVLQRQISSQYFERLARSRNKRKKADGNFPIVVEPDAVPVATTEHEPIRALIDTIKDPYVLEFLGIPDPTALHESDLETAIIGHLQEFMLELGKGFAFVARQKRLSFDGDDLYVDLVFYNCFLKCYLLIDLKMGRLTHGDVGQMDGYVRMFDDLYAAADDNPTIGLILCTQSNNTVARYSVLNDRRQIFASKYVTYLPTEAEFSIEITRERALAEQQIAATAERQISKICR